MKTKIKWTPYLISIALAVTGGIAVNSGLAPVGAVLMYFSGWLGANASEKIEQ